MQDMTSTTFVILAVAVLVLCTVKLKIHPFFALIATTVTFALISGMSMEDMLAAFTSGMGGTVADIGLVIALGTVTGALLEKSGAAETMDHSEDHRQEACRSWPCHHRLLCFHSGVL